MGSCFFAERGCRARAESAELVCFLAAPCAEEVQGRVDQLIRVAEDLGLSCVVAERRQELSREIFCQKICGPIIESRFCMVLLDETRGNSTSQPAPNPNVYFEYGLMCALGKAVIAFNPRGQQIPFNVRHLDLVEYKEDSLSAKAREMVTLALKQTRHRYARPKALARKRRREPVPVMVRTTRRVLDLRGYHPAVPGDVGAAESGGTVFESYCTEGSVLFLAYVGEDGARLEDVGKDTKVLVAGLGRTWDRARKVTIAANSKGWKAEDARRDRKRIEGSAIIVLVGMPEDDLQKALRLLGRGVATAFGEMSIDVWGQAKLAEAERQVGLSAETNAA